jgi:hypothetical protein
MSRPRNGKIARLPREIRDTLNTRLDDSSSQSPEILAWLNSLPDVLQILERDFESRPISEQNLSEWRQGGFRDWQLRQESRERLARFLDLSDDLDDSPDDRPIPDRLAHLLAVELATVTHQLLEQTTDPQERFQLISKALRQVQEIRKDQSRAIRIAEHAEAREQAELDAIDADHAREVTEMRSRATADFWDTIRASQLVQAFGNGEAAKAAAQYLVNINRACRNQDPLPPLPPDPFYDEPHPCNAMEQFEKRFGPASSQPSTPSHPDSPQNQTQSNPIKLNQT